MGHKKLRNVATIAVISAATALAQDQPHAWRPADPSPAEQAPANPAPPPPDYSAFPAAPQASQLPPPNTPPAYGAAPYAPPVQAQPTPARLTVVPGTYITVRFNQPLSSDHNQQGDAFFATLAEPIIVNGVVVAQRGETVTGRVTEAVKAGRVQGTSRLGVELTGITLVDGQQIPVQSQMIGRNGNTSVGRDAAAIATTTALGAAIGAGADWGRGASIGAGAGAAAGILGVLFTRGQQTVIYPEQAITFRLQSPVEVDTGHAPQAFHYVQNRDYGQGEGGYAQRPPAPAYSAAPYPVRPYYGPSYYPYSYYYGGPGLSVYFGSGYYGHRYYRGWR